METIYGHMHVFPNHCLLGMNFQVTGLRERFSCEQDEPGARIMHATGGELG
jgi:hypothetical protein